MKREMSCKFVQHQRLAKTRSQSHISFTGLLRHVVQLEIQWVLPPVTACRKARLSFWVALFARSHILTWDEMGCIRRGVRRGRRSIRRVKSRSSYSQHWLLMLVFFKKASNKRSERPSLLPAFRPMAKKNYGIPSPVILSTILDEQHDKIINCNLKYGLFKVRHMTATLPWVLLINTKVWGIWIHSCKMKIQEDSKLFLRKSVNLTYNEREKTCCISRIEVIWEANTCC